MNSLYETVTDEMYSLYEVYSLYETVNYDLYSLN